MKKNNKPVGFALGNAVGDGNNVAQWLLWSHGAMLVDEDGKVAINSRETINALNTLRELYPTFVSGTLSWLDPSNNRAYSSRHLPDGQWRLAVLHPEERPQYPGHRR